MTVQSCSCYRFAGTALQGRLSGSTASKSAPALSQPLFGNGEEFSARDRMLENYLQKLAPHVESAEWQVLATNKKPEGPALRFLMSAPGYKRVQLVITAKDQVGLPGFRRPIISFSVFYADPQDSSKECLYGTRLYTAKRGGLNLQERLKPYEMGPVKQRTLALKRKSMSSHAQYEQGLPSKRNEALDSQIMRMIQQAANLTGQQGLLEQLVSGKHKHFPKSFAYES